MNDLPPMEPCPVDKRGRHELGFLIPGDDSGDYTFACQRCGAARRVPANGALPSMPERLDDDEVFTQVDAIFGWERR